MRFSKKMTAAAVSALMLTSMLAGCSSGSTPQASSTPAAPSGSASGDSAPASSEPMPIEWLSFYGPESNDTYPQKYLEEKFNIQITNMLIDRNSWSEQLNVKLAGGDIPDIFWTWGGAELANYANQGVLAEIPREKINEKMPGYVKAVEELEPRLWYLCEVDGKNYGIPLYWENGKTPQIPAYNKKWLDKIGAEVPVTMEEFIDVLTKFTNDDPDGNGQKDTYGISFRGKDSPTQTMLTIYGAYGVPVMDWTVNDAGDGVCRSFFTKAWKEATAQVQQLYKDGIIDPESITDDNAQLTQKFANGRVGVQGHGLWYHWTSNSGGYRIATDNAGVEVVYGGIPKMEGYYRESSAFSGGVVNSPVALGAQLGKDAAKMDKCLEILEALHSDEETYVATYFGKEGETYDTVDGIPVKHDDLGDAIQQGTKYGIGSFFGIFGTKSMPMAKYDYTAEQLEMKEEFLSKGVPQTPPFIGTPASSSQYPDISKMENESLIRFVLSELNLETDLETFQQNWLASGGEVLTNEVNELYQKQK